MSASVAPSQLFAKNISDHLFHVSIWVTVHIYCAHLSVASAVVGVMMDGKQAYGNN